MMCLFFHKQATEQLLSEGDPSDWLHMYKVLTRGTSHVMGMKYKDGWNYPEERRASPQWHGEPVGAGTLHVWRNQEAASTKSGWRGDNVVSVWVRREDVLAVGHGEDAVAVRRLWMGAAPPLEEGEA
jgi:hypothetical protein